MSTNTFLSSNLNLKISQFHPKIYDQISFMLLKPYTHIHTLSQAIIFAQIYLQIGSHRENKSEPASHFVRMLVKSKNFNRIIFTIGFVLILFVLVWDIPWNYYIEDSSYFLDRIYYAFARPIFV